MQRPLALLALLLTACPHNVPGPQANSVAPSSKVFLRSSFDTDPSTYLGRFVPAGATDLDESGAMSLACSKHITWRFIDGGGVRMTESLNVSTAVAARLGIPIVASGSGQAQSSRVARAQYELTGKMVAQIADPDAFAACCKSQPDQCTDRYIGEFIQGRGTLLNEAAQSASAQASGLVPTSGVSGGAEVAHEAAWQRVAEFPNPVYFAFKITETPYRQGAVSTCPDWVQHPPTSPDGIYVVGMSGKARSESAARNQALNNATMLVLRASGAVGGDPTQLGLPPVRADKWCMETEGSDKGDRYTAHVLAWTSNADLAAFREAAARSEPAGSPSTSPSAPNRTPPGRLPTGTTPPLDEEPAALPVMPGPSMKRGPGVTLDPKHRPDMVRLAGNSVHTLLEELEKLSFSADKLALLVERAPGLRLSVADTARVLQAFSFSADKLNALGILRPCITDPENGRRLADEFSFSADKASVMGMF